MRRIIPALALLLALTGPGSAGEGPGFYDRPAVGQPLRYTDARGNVFRPRSLVIVAATSTLAAPLPASTSYAASEEHLDLSASPLIGQYFRRRLAPGDAAREGTPVGRVYRLGGALVLDARQFTEPLGGRAVVLTANFPRDGAVSYRLGPLRFAPSAPPAGDGVPAGAAYLLDGLLVLAGEGRGPLITDWGKLLRGD
jgi:hypothetical protein